MAIDEIVLPITEPETEWVRGRALQKMSPLRDHARVQLEIAKRIEAWSAGRGEVGTEWRFRIAVPGEARRPLVPDVSYVENDLLRPLSDDDLQTPPFAPTLAVEVLSPRDEAADVADKVDVYLRGGSRVVIVADPRKRTMTVHDGTTVSTFAGDETLATASLPGFQIAVGPFFARALDRAR